MVNNTLAMCLDFSFVKSKHTFKCHLAGPLGPKMVNFRFSKHG